MEVDVLNMIGMKYELQVKLSSVLRVVLTFKFSDEKSVKEQLQMFLRLNNEIPLD